MSAEGAEATTPLATGFRTLPRALDSVVRAVRTQMPQAHAMALRTLVLWKALGVPLKVAPRQLGVEDHEPLQATGPEGAWLLAASMAGLQSIVPTEEASHDDLLRFAEEVGALSNDGEAIQAFHDWLWADGAENFEVELHESFVERLETVTARSESSLRISTVRGLAAAALGDSVNIRSRDLDLAAVTEMFEELDLGAVDPREAVQQGTHALANDAESLATWTRAQLGVILAEPALKDQVDPRRLSRRLLAWVANETNDDTLALLTRLFEATTGYEQALAQNIDPHLLSDTLGLNLNLHSATALENLTSVMTRLGESDQARLLNHLLRRADQDVAGMALVRALIAKMGTPRAMRVLSTHGLSATSAAGMAKALGPALPQGASLERLLEALSPAVGCALVRAVTPEVFDDRLATFAAFCAAHPGPAEEDGLMMRVFAAQEGEGAYLALAAQHGEGWSDRVLHLACLTLADRPRGQALLASMAADRSVDVRARVAAIRVASRSPALAAQILKAHSWSPFESADIRDRIKALRARTDAERSGDKAP